MPTEPKRILAIHAHPDDIEFQCAGTLALLKQRGCHILTPTMTPGDCGSAELDADEISKIRRAEAKNAADLIEAEYECLEFRDLSIVIDNDSKRRVTEAIRRARPDIVITAPPQDYMADHEATSQLVRDACFNAPIPNYKTQQWEPADPIDHIPHLYYVDPIEGVDYFGNLIEPEFIVDISETFELKREMLACHASQRDWLLKQHGIDEYLNSCERWSAQRGTAIGTKYGEAYRQHKGHPYPHDNLLVKLLG
ncbi:MAG: LmbE family protein [Planctomycetaceae bacterium]|nr:LmbE family protein [Planctomycetaceae bacterium]